MKPSHLIRTPGVMAALALSANAAGSGLILPESVRRATRVQTRDGLQTWDQRTIDSAGAFVVGELERLDQRIYEPLTSVTWTRDIDLRTDVALGDEYTSFTNETYAAAGGPSPNGKSWVGKNTNAITNIQNDIGKTASPMTAWAMQATWSIWEVAAAMQTGRPLEVRKYRGLLLKYNMDIDEQVYIGDPIVGVGGLYNNPNVTVLTPAAKTFATSTPAEILAVINYALTQTWAASGYAIMPNRILLPPLAFSYLVSTVVSTAGNISILEYLLKNNMSVATQGGTLEILPNKWAVLAGASSNDRMVVYTKAEEYIRFPLVPIQHTPVEYRDLHHITTYYAKLGAVEIPRLESISYLDGI